MLVEGGSLLSGFIASASAVAVTFTRMAAPSGENLMALLSRLLITCSTRNTSPTKRGGTSSAIFFSTITFFAMTAPESAENTLIMDLPMLNGAKVRSILPSSIFCMLKMLFSVSDMKSAAPVIVSSNSRSAVAKMSRDLSSSMPMVREFRGVRTSWKRYFKKVRRAAFASRSLSSSVLISKRICVYTSARVAAKNPFIRSVSSRNMPTLSPGPITLVAASK